MKSINTILRKLTFDDLQDWAGETIPNRGKGYVKRVDQLSRTEDNTLAAWVTSGEQYATSVRVDKAGDFEYFCTCPYSWGPCKHTVAVILAAVGYVKRKETIPYSMRKTISMRHCMGIWKKATTGWMKSGRMTTR